MYMKKCTYNSKDSKSVLIFSLASVVGVIIYFVTFHYVKVPKHIWDP